LSEDENKLYLTLITNKHECLWSHLATSGGTGWTVGGGCWNWQHYCCPACNDRTNTQVFIWELRLHTYRTSDLVTR